MVKSKQDKNGKDKASNGDETVMDKLDGAAHEIVEFAKSNRFDAVAFALLIFGFILTFFVKEWGSLIVGAVFAFYYRVELIGFVSNLKEYIERVGTYKFLVFIISFVLLVLIYPFFFVGAALTCGVYALMNARS